MKKETHFRYEVYASFEETKKALCSIIRKSIIHGEVFEDNWYIDKVATWICRTGKPWLMLGGTMGNGKTTTIKALAKMMNILSVEDRIDDNGNFHTVGFVDNDSNPFKTKNNNTERTTFVTAQEICELAKGNKERYEEIKKTRFLFIDEVGAEPVTVKDYGNEIPPIVDILYWRYNTNMMTVMTTNLNIDEIYERYGERIADRMRSHMDYFGCSLKSYRRGAQWK